MRTPAHTNETRPAAAEIKFLLDPIRAGQARAWARAHLDADTHGGGDHDDVYDIATLYLDTSALDVYNRRGSYGRAKYRVRRYGTSDHVFLERKLRRPRLLVKRRTPIPADLLPRLGEGRLEPGARADWFSRRISARALAPACVVGYTRLARQGAAEGQPVRVTLDDDLRAWPAGTFAPSAAGAGQALAEGRQILELKYRGRLPALFRRLIQDLVLVPGGVSKYRLAMAALGHGAGADGTSAEPGARPEARYA